MKKEEEKYDPVYYDPNKYVKSALSIKPILRQKGGTEAALERLFKLQDTEFFNGGFTTVSNKDLSKWKQLLELYPFDLTKLINEKKFI